MFSQLESICPPETIFASNSSTLPVSLLASATTRKDKVIGTHFMNPVPLMKGVEIIAGKDTSEQTIKLVERFIRKIGKEPCAARDRPGFIVSRLVCTLMNEAVRCVMDGNKPEEVDKAMRLCCNFPVGPIELCDLIGSDVVTAMSGSHGKRARQKGVTVSCF